MTSGARVLVVGGGGKGHALAAALAASPSVARVVIAPGTSALEALGFETAPVASQDLAGLVEHAELEEYDLTVVGPNTPLVDGIVDRFRAAGLPICGPSQQAARLEGSKVWARLLMARMGVPTPRFGVVDGAERALHLARTLPWARVFKADGPAYDKGVRVTHRADEAEAALEAILVDNVYGLESKRVVVEERLDGDEATIVYFTDGAALAVLGHVLNYPRLLDGGGGPPTRGMGQVAPCPLLDAATLEVVRTRAVEPVLAALQRMGTPMCGALSVDLMMVRGEPYVIDYNVRFGDPVTQTLLAGTSGDLYRVLDACRRPGEGDGLAAAMAALTRDPRPRVALEVVCEGYPTRMVRGDGIRLSAALDRALHEPGPDLRVYLDGVRSVPGQGLMTTGGRALTLVAAGDTVAEARAAAYDAVAGVSFRGMHWRRDIALAAGGLPQ
ncbi:MAG: phosphoribosylamine--glycine ligase [Myxococcota bacterium]